jgi:hypothetical protein
VSVTAWAWLLIVPLVGGLALVYRRLGSVIREGRTWKPSTSSPAGGAVGADEDGPRRIVEAVKELLNAERVALWLPPYLDEEPRLLVASDDGRGWYDGPSDPDDLFRERATDGASGRTSCSVALGTGHGGPRRTALGPSRDRTCSALPLRPRLESRATSRSATVAVTSSPSPTVTGRRSTPCSPTSTPRSGSSSC